MADFLIKLTGDWGKTTQIMDRMNDKYSKATEQAVLKEAHYLRGKIVQNITSGGSLAGKPFAPLSPMTLAIRQFTKRGGTKPLIVSGGLLGAVTVLKTGGGVFVGIKRAGKGKGGKGGANLAELHEFGGGPWEQPMTAKQRRFLAAAARAAGIAFGKGGGGVIRWKTPARPFVGPVLDMFAKPADVQKRFWDNVSKAMGGDFGG